MWDCEHCGCQAIAGGLTFCPQCYTPRTQESITDEVSAGSAEARSSELSLPADGTPSAGTPDAASPGSAELRPVPKPSPPPARGGTGGTSAAKEWGKA